MCLRGLSRGLVAYFVVVLASGSTDLGLNFQSMVCLGSDGRSVQGVAGDGPKHGGGGG